MSRKCYMYETWLRLGQMGLEIFRGALLSHKVAEKSLSLKFIACVPLTAQHLDIWLLSLLGH